MKDQIVRFKEAADRLSATVWTVYGYAKAGLLELVVLPGHTRARGVTAESLETLIQRSTRKAKTKSADEGEEVDRG